VSERRKPDPNPRDHKDVPQDLGREIANLAAQILGYLASVAVLVYPLGVATLGLQLWVAYGYSLQDSVYAASLAPAATAVTRTFYALYWFLSAFVAAEIVDWIVLERSVPPHSLLASKIQLYCMLFLVLTAAPSVVAPEYIFSLPGLVLWAGFVLLSCVAGIIGSRLRREAGTRWQSVTASITIYLFAIVAGVLLAGTEGPSLPLVEMGSNARTEAHLLGHSNGYWYIIDEEEGLLAVPDSDAGRVRFLRG
jgi:hypothetical protein